MYKEILNEEAVYYGGVNCPKGYEIHREQIKYAMMYGYLEKSKNKKTPVQPLNHTIHLSFLNSYIRDFFKLQQKGKSSLVLKESFSFILKQDDNIQKNNYFNPYDIEGSPVYTMIYGVELENKSSEVIIYHNNKKRVNLHARYPLKNNCFVMFPSHLNFEITKNISKLNGFYLVNNYFEI